MYYTGIVEQGNSTKAVNYTEAMIPITQRRFTTGALAFSLLDITMIHKT